MPAKSGLLQHGILLGAVIVTGLILPNSYDPVSAPKLFMLAIVVGFGLLFVKLSIFQIRKWDLLTYLAFSFAILLVLNLLINNSALSERLFGVSGRYTGFFTLTSFLLLFLIARNCLDSPLTFFHYLASANIVVACYFVSQLFGFDFAKYQEYYGAPSSTLGNPNFVSGFLGFSSIVFVELLRRNIGRVFFVIPLFLFLIFDVWVIGKTDSIQGFVALGIGTSVYCLYGVYISFPRFNFIGLSLVFILLLFLSFLGFFGIGPLSNYIASTTVFSRLDYWRASISMLLDNPFTGVGLDAFGDNYRFYRDEGAIARFGVTQLTDSAHNVYLDMFSYGGFPLGLIFIALNLIPPLILIKRVKLFESQPEKRELVTLLALWCGFQIQTIISVNQIGVTIWIWIILGLMASNINAKTDLKSPAERLIKGRQFLLRIILFVFSATLVFQCSLPLRTNIEFLSAANKADGLAMKNIVERFPQDSKLIAMVASGFQNSNYPALALGILKQGARHNPDSFFIWKLIYDNPKSSADLKTKAVSELMRLDPRFPYSGS